MISRGMQMTGLALSAIGFVVGVVALLHRSTATQPRARWLLLGIILNCLGGMIAFAARLWPATASADGVLLLAQVALSVIGLGCLVKALLSPTRSPEARQVQ